MQFVKVINLYEIYEIVRYIYMLAVTYLKVKYQKDRIYAHSEKCLNGGTVLYIDR